MFLLAFLALPKFANSIDSKNKLKIQSLESKYEKALHLYNSNTNDLKTVTQVYETMSTLCESNISNSCDNKAELEKEMESLKAANAEKKAAQLQEMESLKAANAEKEAAERVQKLENQCKQGDSKMCWDLYVANQDNEHGYRFLRHACLFGHKQACQSKKILDEENQINQARAEAEVAEQEKKSKKLEQSVECFRDAVIGAGLGSSVCNPNCPNYQDCIERRRELQDRFKRKRSTTCSPDIAGGFRCTEN